MTTVSLRLPDELLKEAEHRAKILHLPRAEYIRRAIAAMNEEARVGRNTSRFSERSPDEAKRNPGLGRRGHSFPGFHYISSGLRSYSRQPCVPLALNNSCKA